MASDGSADVREVDDERIRRLADAAPTAVVCADADGKITYANAAALRLFDAPENAVLGTDLLPRGPANGAQYRALFLSNPRPMWVFDVETLRFLAVNDAAVTDYGYTREEFLAMTVADIRPSEDTERLSERIRGIPLLSDQSGWRHLRKNGSIVDVEIRSHELEFEGRRARLVIVHDVTQRVHAEHALRESERRFREMLENLTLVAVILDVNGIVTFCNDHCAKLLGREKDEVVGQSWFGLCVPQDERAALEGGYFEGIHAGRIKPHDQTAVVTKTGERHLLEWNNTVLRDPDGRVVGMASLGTDVSEKLRDKERLAHDALHDALTGLPNRALFLDRLNQARARARGRPGSFFAVLLLDLDRFKHVNDGLGHEVGDKLLVAASKAIQRCVGAVDTVARLGGDEFGVLVEECAGVEDASRIARKVQEAISQPFHLDGQEIFTTASIGIAVGTDAYDRAEDVVRDAHTAMYGAKAQGAAKHVIFKGSMRMRAVRLLQTETDLRRAVERGELRLHYQPIVSLRVGRVVGFEALVRWQHPQRGLVSPLEFIPIAEETGLILPIGRWVVGEACACIRRWEARGIQAQDITVNVNLSGKQFAQADLLGEIDAALDAANLDAHRLKLEVTESVLMESPDAARVTLEALRARGIGLCIDDFGTGYSSLAYLVRLPVDTLKVDRAFVKGMFERGENFEIVRTIVDLAKNLRMGVVAEGVETKEQRAKLEELGCENGQGYLFAKPLEAEAAWALLAAGGIPGAA
jgi:diguanylate cyclase (GGDEF)-like protein/PAS domain S-box-containing protein